ncbi:hypothetical protein NB311A_11302 [Nitrobacter sp. Nb-311A]|uniref:hypothetical protein n=1 Tax=unclassified Nitrobacter TaxID=2620411 RepID=UPI00006865C9|nr:MULTISPECIES: hypothetical protein [unclassified Nitrobacter]EAQ36024.1 hypothetical protein NB311A_11302 [Nitrobacter sp. Nb-311A]MCV0385823.1 hypothetical protein [Nitrobacter sp.]
MNNDQQKNQGGSETRPGGGNSQKTGQKTDQKSEIRKGVEEDNPNNKPQGQEKVGYSGGT